MKVEANSTEEKPNGRQSILSAYKSAYPDSVEHPTDDQLYDFAHERHSALEGKYNDLHEPNSRFAELLSKDPRLGAVISMIAGKNPKSLPYAFASVYGKDALNLEDGELEDYEAGHGEYLKNEEKQKTDRELAGKNFEESIGRLLEYIKGKNLDENRGEELWNGIVKMGENFVMGSIPDEVFDLVYKGLNYDEDVKEAADTGFVEGKNDVIEAKMKEKTGGAPVPNLSSSTGSGSAKRKAANHFSDSSYDEYENIKPVEGSKRNKRLI